MKAILKHELSSHFTGIYGYAYIALILFFAGIYTLVYNLRTMSASFEYAIGSMSFIYLFAIPLITMRSFAEERRRKTDALLYSLPISMTDVVIGKYISILIIQFIPAAILCFYPLILSRYGSINLPLAYASIISFYLLGAALTSVGFFASALAESQVSACGISFAAMLINYFFTIIPRFVSGSSFASLLAIIIFILLCGIIFFIMTRSLNLAVLLTLLIEASVMAVYTFVPNLFEGLFPTVIERLSLFDRFYTIVNGALDISCFVYFISVSLVFIFITIQCLEKRRWC